MERERGPAPGPARCTREQPCVASQFAGFKAAALARVLGAGHAVLWSDVDVVWRANALPLLGYMSKGTSALVLVRTPLPLYSTVKSWTHPPWKSFLASHRGPTLAVCFMRPCASAIPMLSAVPMPLPAPVPPAAVAVPPAVPLPPLALCPSLCLCLPLPLCPPFSPGLLLRTLEQGAHSTVPPVSFWDLCRRHGTQRSRRLRVGWRPPRPAAGAGGRPAPGHGLPPCPRPTRRWRSWAACAASRWASWGPPSRVSAPTACQGRSSAVRWPWVYPVPPLSSHGLLFCMHLTQMDCCLPVFSHSMLPCTGPPFVLAGLLYSMCLWVWCLATCLCLCSVCTLRSSVAWMGADSTRQFRNVPPLTVWRFCSSALAHHREGAPAQTKTGEARLGRPCHARHGRLGVDNKTALLKAHKAWHFDEEEAMCVQPWQNQR